MINTYSRYFVSTAIHADRKPGPNYQANSYADTMHCHRIFTRKLLITGQVIELEAAASHHVARVLRMITGQQIILFNGHGGEVEAEIISTTPSGVQVNIGDWKGGQKKTPIAVHLGQVISRGERMDYVVQKATELGVDAITPLFSQRCEVRLNQKRQNKRQQHWQQVAISACEQSGRCQVPTVHAPIHLTTWLKNCVAELKLVLDPYQHSSLDVQVKPTQIALLVGSEGGFTELEIDQALTTGFHGLRVGPRILRTETAPVTALSILQYIWGDLS